MGENFLQKFSLPDSALAERSDDGSLSSGEKGKWLVTDWLPQLSGIWLEKHIAFQLHLEYYGRTSITRVREEMARKKRRISKSIKKMTFLMVLVRTSAGRPPMTLQENLT